MKTESINLSKKDPTATIHFDKKGNTSIKKINKPVRIGFNLYLNSRYLSIQLSLLMGSSYMLEIIFSYFLIKLCIVIYH